MKTVVASSVVLVVACVLFAVLPTAVQGQESKSTALAKELTQLLDAKKLEAIAAKDPSAPDLFVGALYYPGSQLMVVSARYLVPPILVEKIAKKEFMEVYTDLSSAGIEGSRTLVMDIAGRRPQAEEGRRSFRHVRQRDQELGLRRRVEEAEVRQRRGVPEGVCRRRRRVREGADRPRLRRRREL